MRKETTEYISVLFTLDVAEKKRMMMDAIDNGFRDDVLKPRIEAYRKSRSASEDYVEWLEDHEEEDDE